MSRPIDTFKGGIKLILSSSCFIFTLGVAKVPTRCSGLFLLENREGNRNGKCAFPVGHLPWLGQFGQAME